MMKVAVSAGSACHAGDAGYKLSPVLEAMRVPPEFGLGTLRISFGRYTTVDEISQASKLIAEAVDSFNM